MFFFFFFSLFLCLRILVLLWHLLQDQVAIRRIVHKKIIITVLVLFPRSQTKREFTLLQKEKKNAECNPENSQQVMRLQNGHLLTSEKN